MPEYSVETISKKAGIGENTFYAIERGTSTVSNGDMQQCCLNWG